MFTGLIESTGRVSNLIKKSIGFELLIEDSYISSNIKEGDSVSVDGVCLTVKQQKGGVVSFDVSSETVRRTIINDYRKGTLVNIELAMRPNVRMGGHIITGHIDTIGVIRETLNKGEYTNVEVSFDRQYSSFVVEKGSIAINGVSLTINETKEGAVRVMLIPYTIEKTNLKSVKVGDKVNIEFDIIGKYVIKYLSGINAKDLRIKRLLDEG